MLIVPGEDITAGYDVIVAQDRKLVGSIGRPVNENPFSTPVFLAHVVQGVAYNFQIHIFLFDVCGMGDKKRLALSFLKIIQ